MDVNPKPGAGWAERERLRLDRMVAFHYADALAPLILGRLSREPEVAAVEAARIAGHIKLAAHNIELAQGRRQIPADLPAHPLGAMLPGGPPTATGRVHAMPPRPGPA